MARFLIVRNYADQSQTALWLVIDSQLAWPEYREGKVVAGVRDLADALAVRDALNGPE